MMEFMSLYITWDLTEEAHPAPRPLPRFGGLDIAIRNVSRSFGAKRVLAGLSLTVAAGESLAIVGRSGCGKSTLLRLIAGLDAPSSGAIGFGTDAHDRIAGDVRVMFQEPRLLPWASVAENVAIGLGDAGDAAWRLSEARSALAAVGLADRAAEWPHVLSGGQKQRVALARALLSGPGVLALDEPLGALDALTRIEMQSLLESVWQERRFTQVLVTHDVGEAIALADRVVLIEDGQITLDLAIDLPRPRSRASAAFAALEGAVLERLLTRRESIA
jgi:sulfonate transport system ATP-binding protein